MCALYGLAEEKKIPGEFCQLRERRQLATIPLN
jgi:hypothetical protein